MDIVPLSHDQVLVRVTDPTKIKIPSPESHKHLTLITLVLERWV